MLRPLLLVSSVLVAGVAFFLSTRGWTSRAAIPPPPAIIGKNNTALFLVNSEDGLTNVHVATAQALLERHPHVQVHFASFPPMAARVERVAAYVKAKNPASLGIRFHTLDHLSMLDAITAAGKTMENIRQPPGRAGIAQQCQDMSLFLSPWEIDEHLKIFAQAQAIVEKVDPAVVVLDPLMRPGIDATRALNRLHAIVTPNTLIDSFAAKQPWGAMLWKYPIMGSGFPYPVPWRKIPENLYLNFRFLSAVVRELKRKQKILRARGLTNISDLTKLYRPDVPWLTQTLPGASRPWTVQPANVTWTGPMTVTLGSAAEQDPALAAWLSRAPTVLVNLGGGFQYTEPLATAMAEAFADVLRRTDLQILWKCKGCRGDWFEDTLQPFLDSGRIRIESWLTVDPSAILASGHIVTFVHHGGSGCYHEAIEAGVPHIVLPQWLDHYNFAALVEEIGVGVWGCREASPDWTPGCLRDAILKVADGGDASAAMRRKAKELGDFAQRDPGKYVAARAIAKLAGSGTK